MKLFTPSFLKISIALFLLPTPHAIAQPTQLLAYDTGSMAKTNADDDILAAMRALDEVGALINENVDPENRPNTQQDTADIDLQDLLSAATPNTPLPDAQKKDNEKITTQFQPKHNIQTAPVKSIQQAASAEIAPKAKNENPPSSENSQKHIATDGTHTVASNAGTAGPKTSNTSPYALDYVCDVYKINGIDLKKHLKNVTIAELYQYAFSQKLVYQAQRPAIGDLAFFHNTTDRNRDGRWNDWHTLVGIVENIDENDTISILIFKNKIERIQLNLKYPEIQKNKKGVTLNSQLRQNEGAQIGIASKLFAGFANFLGNSTSVTVIDNWTPGMKL